MLDDLMDMFDRDKRQSADKAGQKRGLRGMLQRLLDEDSGDDDMADSRRRVDDDDERRPGDRRGGRRERDPFDFEE